MPADEKSKNQVKAFLKIHRTASLATVSAHGEPQVATVNYVFDDNFNFFFIARTHSRKFKNLEQNQRVGILVGNDPQIPVIVQMQGTAEQVHDEHYMVEYLKKEVDLSDKSWEILFKTPGVDFVLFRVKVDWIRWLNLNLTAYPETYMKDFEQIIP